MHLPRLLKSLQVLNAPVYIMDSGSTDNTLEIAREYGAEIGQNVFINHPLQWKFALNYFSVNTPWTIGLDADQYLSEQLQKRLVEFDEKSVTDDVDGIYFNRKNYFKGKWIRHGGYFPKYMLKMFRTGKVASDLNEVLDHRFTVPGNTVIWKDGYLLEENVKENNISFWIDKHNRYSDLVAQDEFDKKMKYRQRKGGKITGDPDQRIAAYKTFWALLPLLIRPFLYFGYRYFVRLGFLDGRTGFIFHFLQAFWFRLIVDIKLIELRQRQQ